MKRINIIFDNTFYTFLWLQPLFEAKKHLKNAGYLLKFSRLSVFKACLFKNRLPKVRTNQKYDIVLLAFHQKSRFCQLSIEDRKNILLTLKTNAKKIVWLDSADSTGTCLFDVLPYVDLYLKKQILKDKNLYFNHYCGGRIYIDYYSKVFSLESLKNETEIDYVVDKSSLDKIDVSWNISLWNNIVGGIRNKSKKFLSLDTVKKTRSITPFLARSVMLFFNGSCPVELSSMSFQRKRLFEIIKDYNSDSFIADPVLLPKKDYIFMMKNAMYAPSPFGWGEICNRDFEAFFYGACLIKPSVEHIVTFPNLFIPGETYIPFKWDFSDFKSKLDFMVSKEGMLLGKSVSQKGHDLFFEFRANKGKIISDHIVDLFLKHNI